MPSPTLRETIAKTDVTLAPEGGLRLLARSVPRSKAITCRIKPRQALCLTTWHIDALEGFTTKSHTLTLPPVSPLEISYIDAVASLTTQERKMFFKMWVARTVDWPSWTVVPLEEIWMFVKNDYRFHINCGHKYHTNYGHT